MEPDYNSTPIKIEIVQEINLNHTDKMTSDILQIRDFQVRFDNGQTQIEPIENLHILSEILRIYGRSIIAKISFYFIDNHRGFHNLILRNTDVNDRFVVEFFHDYDANLQKVDMSYEEQLNDFTAVINHIRAVQGLEILIEPYIINPFDQPHQ